MATTRRKALLASLSAGLAFFLPWAITASQPKRPRRIRPKRKRNALTISAWKHTKAKKEGHYPGEISVVIESSKLVEWVDEIKTDNPSLFVVKVFANDVHVEEWVCSCDQNSPLYAENVICHNSDYINIFVEGGYPKPGIYKANNIVSVPLSES